MGEEVLTRYDYYYHPSNSDRLPDCLILLTEIIVHNALPLASTPVMNYISIKEFPKESALDVETIDLINCYPYFVSFRSLEYHQSLFSVGICPQYGNCKKFSRDLSNLVSTTTMRFWQPKKRNHHLSANCNNCNNQKYNGQVNILVLVKYRQVRKR
jgi:hypothetical protein